MKLSFLGATGTVTGSKYLLEDGGKKYLIDCGLFQGLKELRLRNWNPLPVNAAEIDAVLLTHAHLDHSGYLPRLVKEGFRGHIYCSEATFDLCKIILPDSGHIQEEDAERANRYGYTKHKPALPLYTADEARDSLKYFRPLDFGPAHKLGEFLSFTLHRAGHILGASLIRVTDGKTSVLFSGDIGRLNDPVMKPPVAIEQADYLLVESTYGDRLHDKSDPMGDLEAVINKTTQRGGTVVIPSFAVGRAQSIMYYLYKLKAAGRLPAHLPVYLDSPMAINVSDLLGKHIGDHKLSAEICADVCGVAEYTRTAQESKAIDQSDAQVPCVIISASGMATGGRVLHHLKRFIGDARNTILFAGYQAAGTRGDRIVRGESEVKIHGEMFKVRAEVDKLDNMSAHADYAEILKWLGHFRQPPRRTFVTHGEPTAATAMKRHIEERLGWEVEVPTYLETVEF
ncbi:MAG: MBL fold metallo-hydrolase [Alphaproteobacteria bacterium]|nr:MBL fold metallo-hydrolase [Alphaproteobacteria bacterium]